MDEITGVLAMKLVERLSDAEAKLILLAACRDGDIFKATQTVLDAAATPAKKERKKRVKKEKGTSQSVPEPSALRDELPAPRKSRKTLEEKCDYAAKSYPDIWNNAKDNIGIMGTADMVLAEFKRLFREDRKKK